MIGDCTTLEFVGEIFFPHIFAGLWFIEFEGDVFWDKGIPDLIENIDKSDLEEGEAATE